MFRKLALAGLATLVFGSAHAQESTVLQPEEPVILKASKLQPYEVAPGTIISVVLAAVDPDMKVVGMVTTDVYDSYDNVAIPVGSRLLGKQIRQVNDRHEVVWDRLQIPSYGRTFRLEPGIEATMPDGSTGVVNLTLGVRAGAIVGDSFVVPH